MASRAELRPHGLPAAVMAELAAGTPSYARELSDVLDKPEAAITQALRGLLRRGLVERERDGLRVLYRAVGTEAPSAVGLELEATLPLEGEVFTELCRSLMVDNAPVTGLRA
jgi:DNA-binding transcriptional ArsR family regulator